MWLSGPAFLLEPHLLGRGLALAPAPEAMPGWGGPQRPPACCLWEPCAPWPGLRCALSLPWGLLSEALCGHPLPILQGMLPRVLSLTPSSSCPGGQAGRANGERPEEAVAAWLGVGWGLALRPELGLLTPGFVASVTLGSLLTALWESQFPRLVDLSQARSEPWLSGDQHGDACPRCSQVIAKLPGPTLSRELGVSRVGVAALPRPGSSRVAGERLRVCSVLHQTGGEGPSRGGLAPHPPLVSTDSRAVLAGPWQQVRGLGRRPGEAGHASSL